MKRIKSFTSSKTSCSLISSSKESETKAKNLEMLLAVLSKDSTHSVSPPSKTPLKKKSRDVSCRSLGAMTSPMSEYSDKNSLRNAIPFSNKLSCQRSNALKMTRNERALQREIDYLKKQLMRGKSKTQLDIGFLFASPLIYRDEDGLFTSPQLTFKTEKRYIKEAIRESHKAIKFKSKVATKENFSDMLRSGPRILHISCHGRINNITKESCLLFEDQYEPGKAAVVSQK